MNRFSSYCMAALLLMLGLCAKGDDSASGWGAMVGNPKLDEWIAAAISEAPSLGISSASLRVAAADERSARAERRPTFNADVDLRAGQRRNAMTGGETADLEPVSIDLNVAWELDLLGRIRSTVGATRLAKEAGEYVLRDRELAFAAEIAHSYLEGKLRAEQLALSRTALSARETIADYHKARVAAGLERIELRDQAGADRLVADRKVAEAREALALLEMHWRYLMPDTSRPHIASLTEELPEALPKVPETTELHTLALKRPDVQAARALWQSAQQRTKAAKRSRLPTVEALVKAEGDGPSPVEEPEEWIAWAGIRLSLPVLAPENSATTEKRRGEEDAQAALYKETARLALLDIRKAFVARAHVEQQWLAAKQEANQLKAKLDSVTRRFDQGLVPVATREAAHLTWLGAEELRISLHTLALQRHIALLKACGGPTP
ncbi:MAG: TolC family protein [Kiritimatiellia bacterium]|jgi:outer membrane protein TolC|nr:TolC family protein [Kiritimatiellia bacterium]MDP6848582.1 TolC family protein [Kiritimatiellia bacterium]